MSTCVVNGSDEMSYGTTLKNYQGLDLVNTSKIFERFWVCETLTPQLIKINSIFQENQLFSKKKSTNYREQTDHFIKQKKNAVFK